MKKTLALCSLLLLPGQLTAATPPAKDSGALDWSVQKSWQLSVKPIDFSQSLDNKFVFVLGEDSKVYIFSAAGKELGNIPVDESTTAIDIAPRGERLFLVDKNNTYTAIDIAFTQKFDLSGAPFLGNENAPVALVVFSDFEWPYCGKVQPLFEQVLEKNPETVKIVFKHLPLRMHKQAAPAALAAIAAQNQGKFWQMHDALFAISNKLSKASIEKAATDTGLDMEQFKKDMNSQATKQKLAKDMAGANKAGVTGTPALFINGRKVTKRDIGSIQKMVDQELAKTKANSEPAQ